jgi:hypothetical protein
LLGIVPKKRDICYISLNLFPKLITMKLFKHSLYTLMAITGITVAVASCGLTDAVKVNVPLTASDLEFTIPTASAGSDSATFTYSVNLDSLVAAQNSSLSTTNITSIKVDSVDIDIISGGSVGNDFDNITSASLDFTSDATPGTVTTIAPLFTVPNNSGSSLEVPVNSTINLDSYIAAGNVDTHFTFKLHAVVGTDITTPIGCSATVHFTVLAGL